MSSRICNQDKSSSGTFKSFWLTIMGVSDSYEKHQIYLEGNKVFSKPKNCLFGWHAQDRHQESTKSNFTKDKSVGDAAKFCFKNQFIRTCRHLCFRALYRQWLKRNLFPWMFTWEIMYPTGTGRQPASWLGSIYEWRGSWIPIFSKPKVFAFRGSSRRPGCWHPQSSCHLHYSFFTDGKLW